MTNDGYVKSIQDPFENPLREGVTASGDARNDRASVMHSASCAPAASRSPRFQRVLIDPALL